MNETALVTMIISVIGVAASYDLRFRRIPNWLTFPAMVVGLAYNTYVGGIPSLLLSLGGLFVGFGVFILFTCSAAWGQVT